MLVNAQTGYQHYALISSKIKIAFRKNTWNRLQPPLVESIEALGNIIQQNRGSHFYIVFSFIKGFLVNKIEVSEVFGAIVVPSSQKTKLPLVKIFILNPYKIFP